MNLRPVSLLRVLVCTMIALIPLTDALSAPRGNPYDFNKWFFSTTAFTGSVISDLDISYTAPYTNPEQPQDLTVIRGKKSLPGMGRGNGMQFGGFRKNWSFQMIGFRFASEHRDGARLYDATQDASATITGQVYYLRYTWRSKKRSYEPFVGAGFFSGIGPHMEADVRGYTTYAPEIDKYMYYHNQHVAVNVRSPYPQAGLRFKLPIQNWSIAPFYAYSFESTDTRVSATTGNTISAEGPLAAPGRIYEHILSRPLEDQLPPFSLQFKSRKWNQRPGIALYMDFRRFVSLRLIAFRNVTHGRWIVRGLFNLMFHPNVGITAFGEYGERSIATIRYWLVGPTVVFQL